MNTSVGGSGSAQVPSRWRLVLLTAVVVAVALTSVLVSGSSVAANSTQLVSEQVQRADGKEQLSIPVDGVLPTLPR
jgi:hypothetical protein